MGTLWISPFWSSIAQTCHKTMQPRTQACSRYPSDQRRLGTERDERIFPTSLTGDVTSEIAEDDWERGWKQWLKASLSSQDSTGRDNKLWISSTFYLRRYGKEKSLTLSAESKIITFNYRALFFEVNLWFIKNQTRAHTVQKKSLMKTRASHIHTFCNVEISSGGKCMLLSSVITSFVIHENQRFCMRKIETEGVQWHCGLKLLQAHNWVENNWYARLLQQ